MQSAKSPKPLVSVIIPAFNEEKHLAKSIAAMRSSLAYANIPGEIIVVDNESTDETLKIAKRFADHVCTEKRHVIASVRNTGAAHSRGRFLIFTDADTFVPLNLVKEFVAALSGKAVVVGCNVMPHPLKPLERRLFKIFNLMLRVSVLHGAAFSGNCVGYRKEIFKKLNGFDERWVASEDHELSKRAAKLGKPVFLKHLTVTTSNRRVRKLGLPGLILGWSKTTILYVLGIKSKHYPITR